MAEHNGLRSGKGSAFFSKLLGHRDCKHDEDCTCDACERYPRYEVWWSIA